MTNNFDNEVVQYLLIRKDLNMTHGKIAAQASHCSLASVYPYMDDEYVKEWLGKAFTKIVLSINGLSEAKKIIEVLKNNSIIHAVIKDNCRTELEPEEEGTTLTGIGIKPYPKSLIHPLIKKLQLYKD